MGKVPIINVTMIGSNDTRASEVEGEEGKLRNIN